MFRIKSDKIILEDAIVSGYVYYEGSTIVSVTDEEREVEKEYDMTGLYVSPGFIDLHTHGANGYGFIGTEDDVINACNIHLKHGTTSIFPTLPAAPFEKMTEGVKSVQSAMKNPMAKSNIMGAHLEGPYLSLQQLGAQSGSFFVPLVEEEYKKLIETYGDTIVRWTYAPEIDTEGKFCKYLSEHNIVSSAGHTDAIYDDMLVAMENGCHLITHLYSCTSTITRDHGFRRLGVIETAMLHDDMYVEIIADGKHLPKELVQLILKIKGSDKVALVTDSSDFAGCNITHGYAQEREFIIEDGVCKLSDRSAFAGSIAMADNLIRFIAGEVGVPLAEAVKMLTKVPAEIMGLNKGSLCQGMDADIIVFNDNIEIQKVFVMGREIF